jgi:hypothetical protein
VLLATELEKARWRVLGGLAPVCLFAQAARSPLLLQVAEELGDTVRIVKVDTDAEPDLSSQLQARCSCLCRNRHALGLTAVGRRFLCARPRRRRSKARLRATG